MSEYFKENGGGAIVRGAMERIFLEVYEEPLPSYRPSSSLREIGLHEMDIEELRLDLNIEEELSPESTVEGIIKLLR